MSARCFYLAKIWGMDIGRDCCISFSARLDKTHPRGIHIGDETAVNFEAVILTHEAVNNRSPDTWIGKRCQIGIRSIIMPGVRIGDGCIVAPAPAPPSAYGYAPGYGYPYPPGYAYAPAYPYYYGPPVSIGLGFGFGGGFHHHWR